MEKAFTKLMGNIQAGYDHQEERDNARVVVSTASDSNMSNASWPPETVRPPETVIPPEAVRPPETTRVGRPPEMVEAVDVTGAPRQPQIGIFRGRSKPLAKSQDPAWTKVTFYLMRETRAQAEILAATYRMDLSEMVEEGLRRLVASLGGETEDLAFDLLEEAIKHGVTPELRAKAREGLGISG